MRLRQIAPRVALVCLLLFGATQQISSATTTGDQEEPPPGPAVWDPSENSESLFGEMQTEDEVVELRTANSRTFATDIPGVYATEFSQSRLNYHEAGQWRPIDTQLLAAADGFTNAADSVEIAIAGSADDPRLAALSLHDGSGVSFGMPQASDTDAVVESSTATFEDAQPGVDIELQSVPSGLKETIVLESLASPHEFTFNLGLIGLAATLSSSGAVEFKDPAGRVRLVIPPGYMEDSSTTGAGGNSASSTGVTYTLSPDGSSLTVTADDEWLSSPDREFPVRIDPTLYVASESDDTFVSQGATPADQSSLYVLKAGYDGTHVHRAFLHLDTSALIGMNVVAADLSVWQNSSGSCTSSPMDIYETLTDWDGSTTTSWPGPSTTSAPIGTISSGLGYSGSCPGGFASGDVTRFVQNSVEDEDTEVGLSLRARDESLTAQYKQFGSAESYVPPTLNVLWSDPTDSSAPDEPSNQTPVGPALNDSTPDLSSIYSDPQNDDGYVVYFAYDGVTGAFLSGVVTSTVDSGDPAIYTSGSPLPNDYPIAVRALAVDDVHDVPSALTRSRDLIYTSVELTSPVVDEEIVSGTTTYSASLAGGVSATSVEFLIDGVVVASDSSSPYSVSGVSLTSLDGGAHEVQARISGGASSGVTSPPVDVTYGNVATYDAEEAGSNAGIGVNDVNFPFNTMVLTDELPGCPWDGGCYQDDWRVHAYSDDLGPRTGLATRQTLKHAYGAGTNLRYIRSHDPKEHGFGETDIMYHMVFSELGAHVWGETFCDDPMENGVPNRCDQFHVRYDVDELCGDGYCDNTAPDAHGLRALACHETGHAVGLTHAEHSGRVGHSDLEPYPTDTHLGCMVGPAPYTSYLSFAPTTIREHNVNHINNRYQH